MSQPHLYFATIQPQDKPSGIPFSVPISDCESIEMWAGDLWVNLASGKRLRVVRLNGQVIVKIQGEAR